MEKRKKTQDFELFELCRLIEEGNSIEETRTFHNLHDIKVLIEEACLDQDSTEELVRRMKKITDDTKKHSLIFRKISKKLSGSDSDG